MATIFQFPYRTVAEVSLPALLKNLHTLRNLANREVIPVLKADAYGHGLIPVARVMVQRGSCHLLAVATLEEAMELRKKFPTGVGILVLSGFFPHQVDAYTKFRLIPIIHTLVHLKSLIGRKSVPDIHLKIDTGMHRLGITRDQLPEAIKTLEKMGSKLSGVATHFAESENPLSSFSDEQLRLFEEALAGLREHRLVHTDAHIHVANSGGILRAKLGSSTAIRPGLSLYGISPNPRLKESEQLVPALEWKARVLCVKDLQSRDAVGYGRMYRAKRRERIAIIPVGYADGFPRALSNKGQILIQGKKVKVRGRVSMDMTAVDCTGLAGVKEGTPVTLIGKQGKERISAWDLANWAHTLPYEVLCGLSMRVPRLYLD